MLKKIIVLVAIIFMNFSPSWSFAEAPVLQSITIFIAGDSTVANYQPSRAPQTGWGQVIGENFSPEITVKNFAVAGRSSKSFINEGYLGKILNEIQSGDYLFIQFGHNDEKQENEKLYADPDTTYKSYLKEYINGARKRGAIPVLVSPVARRKFDQNGHMVATHGKYPESMRQLAAEEHVLFIDLSTTSQSYFEALGPEKSKELFMISVGKDDNTHFTDKGAKVVAKLIIEELNKNEISLKNYIVGSK